MKWKWGMNGVTRLGRFWKKRWQCLAAVVVVVLSLCSCWLDLVGLWSMTVPVVTDVVHASSSSPSPLRSTPLRLLSMVWLWMVRWWCADAWMVLAMLLCWQWELACGFGVLALCWVLAAGERNEGLCLLLLALWCCLWL